MKPFDLPLRDRRRKAKTKHRSYLSRFRHLTLFFTCVYIALFVLTAWHTHTDAAFGRGTTAPHHGSVIVSASSPTVALSASHIESVKDCPLCDFVAQPVTPPVATSTVFLTATSLPMLPPMERAQPYLPFRFYARSSSRAPPSA